MRQIKRITSTVVLLAAALASLATSRVVGPPAWTYSETSEQQSFSLDDSNRTRTFDVVIEGKIIAESVHSEIIVAAYSNSNSVATVAMFTTDPEGNTSMSISSLTGSNVGYLESEDYRSSQKCKASECRLRTTISFELETGDAATGDFDVTAILRGEESRDGEEGPPPEYADLTFTITER